MTETETVQDVPAASDPALKLIAEVPDVAVMLAPEQVFERLFGEAMVKPVRVSEKLIPLRLEGLPVGFVIVKERVLVLLGLMTAGLKDLLSVGGPITVSVAVAVPAP